MARRRARFDTLWLNRRTVLLGIGATGAAALLPGCKKTPKPPPPPPPGATIFDTQRSLRGVIRSSPDHLAARAAEVIASKDFTRAVRFVRDQIAVVPPPRPTDSATDAVRWGPDATLRAGAGTQRERAELLAAMVRAMGATAKVVSATRPASVDAAGLYQARPPAFSIDPAKLSALGSATASRLNKINEPFPDPDPASVLASLQALIPSGQAVVANPFDGLDATVPLVEYTVNAATKWAFALGTVDEVSAAPAGLGGELSPPQYPAVSVRLMAAMGNVPGVAKPPGLVELAAGAWTADQLAGSRLLVSTPSATPEATVGAPVDDVTLRVPLMQVKRSTPLTGAGDPAVWSPSVGSPAPAAAGGNPFTLSGARFTPGANPGDPPVGPYGALTPLEPAPHAAALASVATLQATANAGAFPDVQLTVSALDAGGQPVNGLVQTDFVVTDEGASESPVLLSNAGVEQLKVMLAYDCSGSITWPTPADKTAFDTQLSNALVGSAASTPFLLGTAPLGGSPSDGYLAPNATTIQNDLASCVSYSDVWTALGDVAPADGVSAVVMVSDFQASDDPAAIPELQRRVAASGLAVALVPLTSTVDQNTVNALVSTCGAVVLDSTAVDFQQRLTDFISGATARAKASGYRFVYRVPADQRANQGTRSAKVALASRASVAATASYAVPAEASRGSLGIAGLYLELTVGSSSTVTRWLSGPALDRFGNPAAAVAADYQATRALLNGLITVAFEPGSPTAAQNADDAVSAMLSMEPLFAPSVKTNGDLLRAGSTLQRYSELLSLLVDPLAAPANGPVTAPQGLRVVVTTEAAGASGLSYHTDVVPELNTTVAASKDAAASFAAAMRAGVSLCLRESGVTATSAAKSLAGASLQYLAPAGNPATLSGFTPADLERWRHVFDEFSFWHQLVPTDPSVNAMWVVDPATGTTTAVLLDGSGGGGGVCAAMTLNAELQSALALLQVCLAYILLRCEGVPDPSPYACTGALIAGVGATVVGFFAGATLGADISSDIAVAFATIPLLAASASTGLAWAVVYAIISMIENIDSALEACKIPEPVK